MFYLTPPPCSFSSSSFLSLLLLLLFAASTPQVGMTDVYFGDLEPIPAADLEHIDAVCRKHIVHIPMQPGDVVFLDNYRSLHGRDVFEGSREHAVAWFGEQSAEDRRRLAEAQERSEGNALNGLLNNYVENAF